MTTKYSAGGTDIHLKWQTFITHFKFISVSVGIILSHENCLSMFVQPVTVEFAVDLGSGFAQGRADRALFVTSNRCIPVKIHQTELQLCFVHVR